MAEISTAFASAFWLGILTSISPCPLASNIAAISYLAKNVGSDKRLGLASALYTFGRVASYVLLGTVIVAALFSIPELSQFLQKYINKALGPILILAGMLLCDLLSLPFLSSGISEKTGERVAKSGMSGAFLLGSALAFAFCPVSAALFFGALIPLSIKHAAPFLLPLAYGIGTAVPVIAFAVLVACGAKYVGSTFRVMTGAERWARLITGAVFILVGIYYCLLYIFQVL